MKYEGTKYYGKVMYYVVTSETHEYVLKRDEEGGYKVFSRKTPPAGHLWTMLAIEDAKQAIATAWPMCMG